MVVGLGTDIIEVERIDGALKRGGDKLLSHLFTLEEQHYCLAHRHAARHFAGRFAAKEAILKAWGKGLTEGVTWLQISLLNDAHGKPFAKLTDPLASYLQGYRLMISISHCHKYATATALLITL